MIVRSLSDTGSFKIGTATFTLRVLDPVTYNRLQNQFVIAKMQMTGWREGLTEADLKQLLNEGGQRLTRAAEALEIAMRDFIRHGIVGHAGIQRRTPAGIEDIPFLATAEGLVSDETLAVYDMQRWLVKLGGAVQDFNGLTEDEEKN